MTTRSWCHTNHRYPCHHWFEDECSEECDRGEHIGGHSHPGCSDHMRREPTTRDLALALDDEISGLFGQDARWIYSLSPAQRAARERDLTRILGRYRELLGRLGYLDDEGQTT